MRAEKDTITPEEWAVFLIKRVVFGSDIVLIGTNLKAKTNKKNRRITRNRLCISQGKLRDLYASGGLGKKTIYGGALYKITYIQR
jgi:hypothetical protein